MGFFPAIEVEQAGQHYIGIDRIGRAHQTRRAGQAAAERLNIVWLTQLLSYRSAVGPCDDGLQPCRRAVVKNMASGALPWEQCISHRIGSAEAPDLFQRLNEGKDGDIVGAVINRHN